MLGILHDKVLISVSAKRSTESRTLFLNGQYPLQLLKSETCISALIVQSLNVLIRLNNCVTVFRSVLCIHVYRDLLLLFFLHDLGSRSLWGGKRVN